MSAKPTLQVVDLASDDGEVEVSLRDAAEFAFELDTKGKRKPLDDFWRDRAAKLLHSRFPACTVYRGGHHVALHAPGPMKPGCMESSPCLGRIVEAREKKGAA